MERRIDSLGRIVIPSEIRYRLKWDDGDFIYIQIDEQKVILEKVYDLSTSCGSCQKAISKGDCFCRFCGTKVNVEEK